MLKGFTRKFPSNKLVSGMNNLAVKIIILLTSCIIFNAKAARTILFLGDSLTEGYGIEKEKAYPSLVENMLKKNISPEINVINGGVSGSTSNDGIARLKWYLNKKPQLMFLTLGANDGLRGLNAQQTQKNLSAIVKLARDNNIKVLLSPMRIPPNYGPEYTKKFKDIYLKINKEFKLQSMPFLLDGVAGIKKYNLKDGIHPNELGHKILAQKVYEFIKDKI